MLQDPNSPSFALPELSLPEGIPFERLQARRELQQLVDAQARMLDYSAAARGLDGYYEKAIAMLQSPKLREAFNLSAEPEQVRESYGRTTYGQSCLLARRLIEAGTKFVTVYFDDSIGGQSVTDGGWDTHGFNNTRMFPIVEKRHLPITEQTLPTLLIDLEERGLLDETLVVWMGEFGRTPNINKNVSRDHWPQCSTHLPAVERGFVHGRATTGAYPAKRCVRRSRRDDLPRLGIDRIPSPHRPPPSTHQRASGDGCFARSAVRSTLSLRAGVQRPACQPAGASAPRRRDIGLVGGDALGIDLQGLHRQRALRERGRKRASGSGVGIAATARGTFTPYRAP